MGCLPEVERGYLLKNLIGEQAMKPDACIGLPGDMVSPGRTYVRGAGGVRIFGEKAGVRWGKEELDCFPSEEALFISGDEEELYAAAKAGMAHIRYLPPQAEAREQRDAGQEVLYGTADLCAEGFEEVGFSYLVHVYERHHGIPWTILETERCVVKEFSLAYLDALFELYAGEGMTDYMEPLFEYEKEKEYQKAYIEHVYRFYGYGTWIVCRKDSGKLIGRVGIEHREELSGEPELGYAVGVPYQGQGYATEVCRAVLSYAKEELGMRKMNCLIEPGNDISFQLASKLGFARAGTMRAGGKEMERYILFMD